MNEKETAAQEPNIYLNGRFLPPDQGQISVMDRGFLFGDGVYEVIPCYGGRLFRLSHHLQRLENSLTAIRMENPHTLSEWNECLQQLVDQLPGEDQSVYLQVTRGPSPNRDHSIPEQTSPTVFAMTKPMAYPDPQLAATGVDAITLEDNRWHRCNIKAITLLANVLLRSEAAERNAAEAILIRDGMATEGAASNLFIVTGGTITTPPKSEQLLPGITRDLILELAAANDLPYSEAEISLRSLEQADEIWLTSSTKEIVPVVRLNDRPVGNGEPGPMFRKASNLYAGYKSLLKAGKVEA